MNQLYKFYNRNASSIRGIMIANCPWLEDDSTEPMEDAQMASNNDEAQPSTSDEIKRAGNPLSQPKMFSATNSASTAECITLQPNQNPDNSRSIQYLAEFRNEFEDKKQTDDWEDSDEDDDSQGL